MRTKIKQLVYAALFVLVIPIGYGTKWFCRATNWNALFNFWAETLAFVPGPPGLLIRSCFYNQVLKKAHSSLMVKIGALFTSMETEVGRNVRIGRYTTVGLAKMADNSSIGGHCALLSGANTHNFEDPTQPVFNGVEFFTKINIGQNSFVGENCTVMADIGDYTIIGAGSIVVKPIPDLVVAVGNPARVVKRREKEAIPANVEKNG